MPWISESSLTSTTPKPGQLPPTCPLHLTRVFNMKNFTTSVLYIARDPLYREERPFSCDFDHGTSVFATNHKYDKQPATIHDIVDPTEFDLDVHGFCVLKGAKTAINPEAALADKPSMEDAYAEEVAALMHRNFPEYSRFEMMNVVVSAPLPSEPDAHDVEFGKAWGLTIY